MSIDYKVLAKILVSIINAYKFIEIFRDNFHLTLTSYQAIIARKP